MQYGSDKLYSISTLYPYNSHNLGMAEEVGAREKREHTFVLYNGSVVDDYGWQSVGL